MKKLLLYYSHCKECGKCCFECEFLDFKKGCTNEEYRLKTRCASFPIIKANLRQMGHINVWDIQKDETSNEHQDQWFIFDSENCLIQQKEILFNSLRWVVKDINQNKILRFFSMSYGEENLIISSE